ncbi:polysaccharide biosynthesis tyrosine autokinase [Demequina activiva]|uniref:Chromosome partitioning protein n=1 Tax=Demequina activiva TaxID=1582364 RepID=A0A919Q3I8_9MICO|nr:polysaccharide biosynthesis tyrosine autokinase [Demequina activiva]GIG53768.1 chromosome partitioning protein [Demequina activiva]
MELQDYAKVLRAHWIAIVAFTLAGAVLAFAWTLTQPRVYTANSSAIITTGVSQDLGQALVGDNYAKSRVKSYEDIATSRRVAEFAAEDLGLEASPQSLVSRVSVTNPLDTAVLRISADASTPEEAKDLAESWIEGMVVAVQLLENNADSVEQLPDEATSVVELQTLDSAVLPGAPSSPNVRLAVALGLMVGLALGVAYALVRGAVDRRLRTPADIEKEFDLPVLGALPFDKQISDTGAAARSTDFATTESVRELRTNLQFMDVDNPPRIIVVTSSLPGDGKSTVTIKLAEAIAESGQPVVLVDADLRRPRIAEYLGLVPGAGLTDVLVGRATLDEVLQEYGPTGRFHVLGAGTVPPNPSELLGSSTMRETLDALDSSALVLIDTPPLIPVTDAAILTARTDGALIVVRSGKTTIDLLDRALVSLDKVKGRALGVIVDGMARKGPDSHYYGYAYEYSERGKESPTTHRRHRSAPMGGGGN